MFNFWRFNRNRTTESQIPKKGKFVITSLHSFQEFVDKIAKDAAFQTASHLQREFDVALSNKQITSLEEDKDSIPEFGCLEADCLKDFVDSAKESSTSTNYVRRDLTNDELINIRGACLWWYRHDPFGRIIPTVLRAYAIGRGVKFAIQDEEVMEAALNFWNHPDNAMESRQKKLFWYWLMDGDLCCVLAEDESPPYLKIRRVSADEVIKLIRSNLDAEKVHIYVRERIDKDGNLCRYGYVDVRNFFNAKYQWRSYEDDFEESLEDDVTVFDDQAMLFAPFDSEGSENGRGMPLMFSVLKHLRWVRNFKSDRVSINHFASRFMFTFTQLQEDSRLSSALNLMKPPRPGTVLKNTPSSVWGTLEPKTNAVDAKADLKMLIEALGLGYLIPYHILTGDASYTAYASIKEADTPFSQFILSLQDDFGNDVLRPLIRAGIRAAVKSGVLKEKTKIKRWTQNQLGEAQSIWFDWVKKTTVDNSLESGYDIHELVEKLKGVGEPEEIEIATGDIPIDLIHPEMIQQDPKAVAEGLQIMRNMGCISLQTVAEKMNLNWETELDRLASEARRAANEEIEKIAQFQKSGVFPDEGEEKGSESSEK